MIRKAKECRGGILYLEPVVPWKEALRDYPKDILFVIYPSIRGGYNIQAVPCREDKNALRHPFPQSWCGASPQELQKLTGIKDITFCHKAGFLSVAETLEGAFSVARLVIHGD